MKSKMSTSTESELGCKRAGRKCSKAFCLVPNLYTELESEQKLCRVYIINMHEFEYTPACVCCVCTSERDWECMCLHASTNIHTLSVSNTHTDYFPSLWLPTHSQFWSARGLVEDTCPKVPSYGGTEFENHTIQKAEFLSHSWTCSKDFYWSTALGKAINRRPVTIISLNTILNETCNTRTHQWCLFAVQ